MEQILPDRNISESDPLANVANNSSTLIFRTLQYKGPKNKKNARKFVDLKQIPYFQRSARRIFKMRMCLNVIDQVLAILAIGLVNISFVSYSCFKI